MPRERFARHPESRGHLRAPRDLENIPSLRCAPEQVSRDTARGLEQDHVAGVVCLRYQKLREYPHHAFTQLTVSQEEVHKIISLHTTGPRFFDRHGAQGLTLAA